MGTATMTPSKRKIIAEDYEDASIYAKLSKERPEGDIMLNEQEKADFEKWLGV